MRVDFEDLAVAAQKWLRRMEMKWTEPDFEEISLSCEINCYAKAEL
jgi:coenzyme PQQ precursor peptide PqqA